MRSSTCLLGTLIFSQFTYWQLNDVSQYKTDALICYLWIASYAYVALLSLLCAFKKLPTKVFLWSAVVPFIIAAFRFTAIDWSYDNVLYNPNNPAANETGGLLIMGIWLLILRRINTKDVNC